MKKTNKIAIGVIIIGILLLGIGYAAIQNITLYIKGTVTADPSQDNFKVRFTQVKSKSETTTSQVLSEIVDDLNATIDVTGLTLVGETVFATYEIKNESGNLSADLAIKTTNNNEEYFEITSELAKSSLTAGETTTVTVTVELIKAPLIDSVSATVNVEITAAPVQPGEEGTTGGNEETVTTLSSITNANIGEYIDLGNDIVDYNGKTDVTTDDWRIFYVENDTVYVILSSYLPAEDVPTEVGLATEAITYPYGVKSTIGRADLIAKLTHETAWNGLGNGISGVTVEGTPTMDLLLKSYNKENETSFDYEDEPNLKNNCTTGDCSLYVPHNDSIDDCQGYWLASGSIRDSLAVYGVYSNGDTYGTDDTTSEYIFGIRPIVSLPSNTAATKVDGIWTVTE